MGHRQMFNTSQIFETDNVHGWNHSEQPYMQNARAGAPENNSLTHPPNMVIQNGHTATQWTPAPRSSRDSSWNYADELPHYHSWAPGPSQTPYLYQSAAGSFHMQQDNYSHHPASANHFGQTVSRIDGGVLDQTEVSGVRPYKRKYPGNASVFDRGSTSRYHDVGSNFHLHDGQWEEKQRTESHNRSSEYRPNHEYNFLSSGTEVNLRNMRSRTSVYLDPNQTSNTVPNSFSDHTIDQSNLVDGWRQTSNAPSREWNHNFILPAVHGEAFNSNSRFSSHEPNPLNLLNNRSNAAVEVGGYKNDTTSHRDPVSQNLNGNFNNSVTGARSGCDQRAIPTFRASSSNFHSSHVAVPDERLQTIAESYPSRHLGAFSSPRMRHIGRNWRNLTSSGRHRAYNEETSLHDRLSPEGVMAVHHRSPYHGSRTLFDHYRSMRLDVDNMSYEELLALGERIGSVSTGLSDDLISKCLVESTYLSSDIFQDEGTCVICLDDYRNMDDVGTMKVCGHDFHVACIRKWLSIKHLCPICKATAADDNAKIE
ncbi:hypothetical protein F511_29861 [Dorcoceras hygrometricum]|uniref:RING-type E3 ubiquitin transferase n=1 Tax=Dorcoceras hygrometricum TaxID=472368 RepID=A0A2Z7BGR2_9LAMI|nr:hypothetical protein F511_29861 [Dorcoceras hygrometricum]